MREIKFRAWDGKEKQWLPAAVFGILGSGYGIHYNGMWQTFDADRFTVSQFTGLKDKNGVAVFEGDIVQPYTGGYKAEICQIKYLERAFCMALPEDTQKMDCVWYYDFEVIGNIYEHPELLDTKAEAA